MNICTSMNDTQRAILTVSVCEDGSKLLPMLIFKGTENGQMCKKNSQNFHLAVSIISRKMHGWIRGL